MGLHQAKGRLTASFVIYEQPKPWDRARLCGKRFFKDKKQVLYRGQIFNAWFDSGCPFFGTMPLEVTICCVFEKKRTSKLPFPTYKMDVDNLAKEILDTLNKHAYDDDGQVLRLLVEKRWAQKGEGPHTSVKIEEFLFF
jgi:Holliday junction resolvase RusA-like endonuclease